MMFSKASLFLATPLFHLTPTSIASYPHNINSIHDGFDTQEAPVLSMKFDPEVLRFSDGKSSKTSPKSSKSSTSSKSSKDDKDDDAKKNDKDKKNPSKKTKKEKKKGKTNAPTAKPSKKWEDSKPTDSPTVWSICSNVSCPVNESCDPSDRGHVTVPENALNDPLFRFHNVSREDLTYDNSNSDHTPDDWLELCGLRGLSPSTVRTVGLFVDQSGSMNKRTVQSSLNKFLRDAAAANLTICEVSGRNEDWITPLNTYFHHCQEALHYEKTNRPTFSPTVTPQPSSEWPTWTPTYSNSSAPLKRNVCLSKPDLYRTCFQRAADPNNDLVQDEILRGEYTKGALEECGEYSPSWNESYVSPYTPPYFAEGEVPSNGTVYLSILTRNHLGVDLGCDDLIDLEEVLLEWLYDNVGGPDSFQPICAHINDYFIQDLFGDATVDNKTEYVSALAALKIDLVYAYKEDWLDEVFNATDGLFSSAENQNCDQRLLSQCCLVNQMNGVEKANMRDYCKEKGCKRKFCNKQNRPTKKPTKKPTKNLDQDPNQSKTDTNIELASIGDNLTETELFDAIKMHTRLDAVSSGAILNITDLKSIAICSASHHNYTEYYGGWYIDCEDFDNAQCDINDYMRVQANRENFCHGHHTWSPTSPFPTWSPTSSPQPSSSPNPAWHSDDDWYWHWPSKDPTRSPQPSTSPYPTESPTTSSQPSRSPSPTWRSCYFSGQQTGPQNNVP